MRAGRRFHAEARWIRLWGCVAENASDHSNLGAALRAAGSPVQAEQAYRRAIGCDPEFSAAHYNLANLLSDANRLDEAAASFTRALELRGDYAEASHGLGLVQQRIGQLAGAVDSFRNAARLAPQWPEAWTNLGVALLGQDEFRDAEAALQRALALKPKHAPALGNLGALHLRAGRAIAAEAASRAAISHAATEQRWHTNLAVALQMQGRHAEAEACYRRALVLKPDYATGHGNLLFALNYRDDLLAEAIFEEYRAWDERHARPLAPAAAEFAVDRTPGRRLRVGYVSADFRAHAAALFAEPLLAAHDRDRVERCFVMRRWQCRMPTNGALSGIGRPLAQHIGTKRRGTGSKNPRRSDRRAGRPCRPHRGQSAARVRTAAGGGAGGLSARAWLQHWAFGDGCVPGRFRSGARGMALISSVQRSKPGATGPRIPLAYAARLRRRCRRSVGRRRRLERGYVTFGHFGRPERAKRTGDRGLVWAFTGLAVPDSRLALNSRPFQDAAFAELFSARFEAHGIARDRLDLICTMPQTKTWAAYGGIDIALDPFPHNAGTTTIEALWQGVPVITLAGRPSVGRFGACILHAVGMDDWVTGNEAAYVARAVAAANDPGALAPIPDGVARAGVAASRRCEMPDGLRAACRGRLRNIMGAMAGR